MFDWFKRIFTRNLENPNSSMSNPSNWFVEWVGGTTSSGEKVTPLTAIQLPAAYRAIRVNAETISSVPFPVYKDTSNGREIDKAHPVYNLLNYQPNPRMSSYDWREMISAGLDLYGNQYNIITWDDNLQPLTIEPIDFNATVKTEVIDGELWYSFNNGKAINQVNILHFSAIMGKSPVSVARENIGLGLAAQKSASTLHANGSTLGGWLEVPKHLDDKGLRRLKQTWKNEYEGSDKSGSVPILEDGMKFHEVSMSPEDAQWLETRKMSVTDIARIWSVPPPLIYDLERATYSNIENLDLSYVKYSVAPRAKRIEAEINRKLFLRAEMKTHKAEHNLEGLLRGDSQARAAYYQVMIMIGAMSPNEVRAKENLNPYDGGDTYTQPMNVGPIDMEREWTELLKNIKQ